MKEYKGIYYGNNFVFHHYFEAGAHFKYIDLYNALLNLSTIDDIPLEAHSKSKNSKAHKIKRVLFINRNKRKVITKNNYQSDDHIPIISFPKSKKYDKINIENDNTYNDKYEIENFSSSFNNGRFTNNKFLNNDSYDYNKKFISRSPLNHFDEIYFNNYQKQTSYASSYKKSKTKILYKNKEKKTCSKSSKNKKHINNINKKNNLNISTSVIFIECSNLKKLKLNSTMKIENNKKYSNPKKKDSGVIKIVNVSSEKIKNSNNLNRTIHNQDNVSKIFINLSHATKKTDNNTVTSNSANDASPKNKLLNNISKKPINLKEKNHSNIMLTHRLNSNGLEEFDIWNKKNKNNKISFQKTFKTTLKINPKILQKNYMKTAVRPQILFHKNRVLKNQQNYLDNNSSKITEFDNYTSIHTFEEFKKNDLEFTLHNTKSLVINRKKRKVYCGGEDIPKGRFKRRFTNYYNKITNGDLCKILFIG